LFSDIAIVLEYCWIAAARGEEQILGRTNVEASTCHWLNLAYGVGISAIGRADSGVHAEFDRCCGGMESEVDQK
jgi:hypothetical protein